MGVEIDPADTPDRAVRIVGDHADAEVPAACDGHGAGLGLGADGQEGLYMAELDLEQLRNYRKKEVHGNAYRHPKKYGLLTDTKIDEPFVRKDYRG